MKKLILLGIVLLGTLNVFAGEIRDVCSTCISDLDFEIKVQLLTFNKMGNNNVLIGNVNNAKLKYFYVSRYEIAGEGWPETTITQIPVPSQIQAEFDQAVDAKNQIAARTIHEIDSKIVESAWDLVGQPFLQRDLISSFNEDGGITQYTSLYVGHMLGVFGKTQAFNDDLIFTFPDGSWALFNVSDIVNGALTFEFVEGEDLDGNKIEKDDESFKSQTYRFSITGNYGLDKFLEAGTRVGITLVSNTSGTSYNGTIACDAALLCSVTINES